VAEAVRRHCLTQWNGFAKPHVFGEFGIRSHSTTAEKDPKGWAIHNSLWAGRMTFAAGGPMPWWHENYIDPLDLYFHFTAVSRFTAALPPEAVRWDLLRTSEPEYADKSLAIQTRDALVLPAGHWGKPQHSEFTIQPDGQVAGDRIPDQLLHGGGHPDLKNPPEFVVEYPKAGKFVVRVGKVSSSGLLKVAIDGQEALAKELPCAKGLGRESVYQPRWKLWETTYDLDVPIDVPAGKHRIRVDNAGRDWVTVTKYTFTGCMLLSRPNVLVCGMKTDRLAMLWLQNRESSWYNHARGEVPAVPAFRTNVLGLPDGAYEIAWWDTWHGKPLGREEVRSASGRLPLSFPELTTDAALTIRAK
jgi:hypothetical protein